jgi:DNA repair exonuclease SbcCD ATPase subunit
MVLGNIERIKSAFPDLVHVVIFYDDGIVFQSTFEQSVNKPQVGETLAAFLSHLQKLFITCKLELVPYAKMIFETKDMLIFILRLVEKTNLALFFKIDGVSDITYIRRYLLRIEILIDTDRLELEEKSLEERRGELLNLEQELKSKLEFIEAKKNQIIKLDEKINSMKQELQDKQKEIEFEDNVCEKLEQLIEIKKEKLESSEEKEKIKLLKQELKEEERNLSTLEKSVDEKEKVLEQTEVEVTESINRKKESILIEINVYLEEIKKVREQISEKNAEITLLNEKINQLRKEIVEKKNAIGTNFRMKI